MKLTVTLFPPRKAGTKYTAAGSMKLSREDVHELINWANAQEFQVDDYDGREYVSLAAFQYQNTSKAGKQYTTVQLLPPVDLQQDPSRGPASAAPAAPTASAAPTALDF